MTYGTCIGTDEIGQAVAVDVEEADASIVIDVRACIG